MTKNEFDKLVSQLNCYPEAEYNRGRNNGMYKVFNCLSNVCPNMNNYHKCKGLPDGNGGLYECMLVGCPLMKGS